jgi:hypothetical protein
LTVGQNVTVSGNTSISGSVGIGTTTPGSKVDAYASGTTATIIRARNDTTTVYLDADNAYSYLNTYTNHPMLFGTNNIERMRINTSGHVTMPYQPAFYAYRAGATFSTSATEFIFDATRLNRGSHYNTTTGRFTAPVAGAYFFSATGLPNSALNAAFLRIFKNNGTWSCSTYVINADQSVSLSVVMDMAAGDYASVYVASDGFETSYCCFSGFLIG